MALKLGKFKKFPEGRFTKSQIIDLYNKGFAGVGKEPEIDEELKASLTFKTFGDIGNPLITESGKGKLSLPFLNVTNKHPKNFPGPAQTTGSCVSRSTINAGLITIYSEVALGLIDEKLKTVEGYPPDIEVPNQQQFDHAIIYGCRGHRGQGSSCSRLAKAVSEYGGFLPRGIYNVRDYGTYDCRRYSDRAAHNFGPQTPKPLLELAREKSFIRDVTYITELEQARDALAQGFGISACSGVGFQGERNEHGVTRARGSWSHAMAWIGCDDRSWAHKTYGGPLFLIQNSWAAYNRGNRKIHDSVFSIPHGSFWAVWKDALRIIRSQGTFVFSSAKGFPPRNITEFGTKDYI